MVNKSNVWSKLNDQEWLDLRSKLDWMSAPWMHHHVTQLMGGLGWIDYARDTHLKPLANNRAQNNVNNGLEMLTLGCGNAWVEMHCLEAGWPISRLHCAEYDESLLQEAQNKLTKYGIEKKFSFFDFNESDQFDFGKFDLIFFCHSFHHCMELESMMEFVNRSLKHDGIVMGCDYFGPSRLQVEPEVEALICQIFEILPEHLRYNISAGTIETIFKGPTLKSIMEDDPSEAPRSRDLRSLLFSNFPVIDIKPMGGTLMRPLLTHRAGNFRSDSDHVIVRLLQLFERTLILERVLTSDDLFFVCGRSDRV